MSASDASSLIVNVNICQHLSTTKQKITKVLLQSHLFHCRCDLCGTAAFASDEVDLVLAFLRGCVEMLAQVIVQQAIPTNLIESTAIQILKKKIFKIQIYIYINFIDACIPVPGLLRPLENNSWQLMKDGKVKSQQRNTILAGTQQMQLSSLPSLTTRIMPCVLHATDVLVQASLVVTALRRPKADKALQLILLISMEKGWATIMYTAKKFFRQHAHHSGFSTCCC